MEKIIARIIKKIKAGILLFVLTTSKNKRISLRPFYKMFYNFVAHVIVCKLKKNDFILSIYVGGSFARGDFTPGLSDIDFAFILKEDDFVNNERKLRKAYLHFSRWIPIVESWDNINVINVNELQGNVVLRLPTLFNIYRTRGYWKILYGKDMFCSAREISQNYIYNMYFEEFNFLWHVFYVINNEYFKPYQRYHVYFNILRNLAKITFKDRFISEKSVLESSKEFLACFLNSSEIGCVEKLLDAQKNNFLGGMSDDLYKKLENIIFKFGFFATNKIVKQLEDLSVHTNTNNVFKENFSSSLIYKRNYSNIKYFEKHIGAEFNITYLTSVLYEIDNICVFIESSVDDLPLLLEKMRRLKFKDYYTQHIWIYVICENPDIALSLDVYTPKVSGKFFITPHHDPFIFCMYHKNKERQQVNSTYLKLFLQHELIGFKDLFKEKKLFGIQEDDLLLERELLGFKDIFKNGDVYKLEDVYLLQYFFKICQLAILSRILYLGETGSLPMTSKDIIIRLGEIFTDRKDFLFSIYSEYVKIFEEKKHDLTKQRKHIINFCEEVIKELFFVDNEEAICIYNNNNV